MYETFLTIHKKAVSDLGIKYRVKNIIDLELIFLLFQK